MFKNHGALKNRKIRYMLLKLYLYFWLINKNSIAITTVYNISYLHDNI